ncbi:DNA primase [Deinococcus cellulosilyticus]|uniref:DNA primase n=1 Tax=Deinococcus cellulosilyticus (strain DSM 18568 / NBRC 106333 / KACC 11606 / 5516J-15) TaxID=1223518 RepID=A0A511N2Q9_DEIC1|nr:DNA primase [Deinococcus cellulosilyticus]GEM47133.1 DNA primase [Deinococcus cellulosilyticus NBRC 106333 = KACC 11606]
MGTKEEIKARLNLADLIGEYVRLTPAGNGRFKGLCPFHKEKSPSFNVDINQGYYYCFGCKAGGDAFKFLMQVENLPFSDALQKLADRTGVKLDFSTTEKKQRDLFEINEMALTYFRQSLHKPEGHDALGYLYARGLTEESITQFELGYAPGGWDGLIKFCKLQGVHEAQLLQAGLLSEAPDTGRVYDRFRNRVMFPIRDYLGRLVGFGGRVLDDSKPKYLNTPETDIFKKSELLYGFNLARSLAQSTHEIVVVEGYMDVIAMHQWGFKQAVATLGTALTAEHGALLARQGIRTVKLMFDQDSAGQKATLAGLDQMLGSKFLISAHQVPSGKDPADALQHGDTDSIKMALFKGLTEVEFRIQHAMGQFDLSTTEGKRGFLQMLLPRMQNHDLIDEVAAKIRARVAEALEMDERKLAEWVESRAKRKTLSDVQVQGMVSQHTQEDRRELFMAQQILLDPTLLQKMDGNSPFRNKLVEEIIRVAREKPSREAILDHFRGRPEEKILLEFLFENPAAHIQAQHQDMVERLKDMQENGIVEAESLRTETQMKEEVARLKKQLLAADPTQQIQLLRQIGDLQKAIEAEKRGRMMRPKA